MSDFIKEDHRAGVGRALPAEALKKILPTAPLGIAPEGTPGSDAANRLAAKEARNCNVATVPHKFQKISNEEAAQVTAMLAGGATPAEIAGTFDITTRYVRLAAARRFGSIAKYKEMLLGLTLENAVACQAVASMKADELTGPQAILGGKLLVETALAIEGSIQNAPKTIDFAAIKRIGETLERVKSISQGKIVEQVAQSEDQTTSEIRATHDQGVEFDPRGA